MINKINVLFVLSLIMLSGCAEMIFTTAGFLKEPYKYTSFPFIKTVTIEIDGEDLTLYPLGDCSTKIGFLAIALPIPLLPIEFLKNDCEKGFVVLEKIDKFNKLNKKQKIDNSKITYQLKYNNKIYDPVLNSNNNFNILDFKSFKKAEDKTLIIHKKRDDGTIITKEIPFEWKLFIDC